jgi:uncharacterized protein (TIGR02246 family)
MGARTPEECDALFARHLNAGDADAVAALYEPQATLVLEGRAPAVGTDAIRSALRDFVALRPTITMNVVRMLRAGDDVAVLYNDWSLSATQPDGTRVADTGRALEVVRRQADGTWRFVVDDPRGRG